MGTELTDVFLLNQKTSLTAGLEGTPSYRTRRCASVFNKRPVLLSNKKKPRLLNK